MSSFIDSLEWRYATKKFDSTKKISDTDLQALKSSIRLAASSYGLQPYKVLIIENPELREKLKPASWGQTQITDASHLFVFCTVHESVPEIVDAYLQRKADTQNLELEAIKGYGDFMKSKLGDFPEDAIQHWKHAQTYIALGNLLAACAELRIDACPMEGFENEQYDEILGLSAKGLHASVVATVGYRHEEDQSQHAAKVRKSEDVLFELV